ncbi:MAG: extracellular solute-binding protein [Oligoflexus sp.]
MKCTANVGSWFYCIFFGFCSFFFLRYSVAYSTETEKQLQFWVVANGIEDAQMYQELAADFTEKTGISVAITPLAWGNFNQKYLTAMAAGMPPDVGVTNLGSPMEWGSVGGLVDFYEAFPEEIEAFKKEFLPGMFEQFEFRQRLFAIPTELVTMLLYYRTDVFARLQIKPPETWSELQAAIRKLETNSYRFHYGWTKGEQWALSYHTMPYDLAGVRLEGEQVKMDWLHPLYQKSISHALDLWYLHGELGGLSMERQIARFLSDIPDESIALMADGNWLAAAIHELAPEERTQWQAIPWPQADDGKANNIMGGTSYVIFNESKMQKEGFAWIRYLSSLEVQQRMLLSRLQRPGQGAALNIAPIRAIWEDENREFWQQDVFLPFTDVIEALRQVSWTFQSTHHLKGQQEANLIEARILDRLRSFAYRNLENLARKHNLTIWDYVKASAAGEYPEERQELRESITTQVAAEYKQASPYAQDLMQNEQARYEERYGNIIDDLQSYQGKLDILDYLEFGTVASVLVMMLVITAIPRYRKHFISYLFIAIPVLLAMIFVVLPMLTAFYLSLTEYHAVLPLSAAQWVDIQHYLTSFSLSDNDNILLSLSRTFIYVGFSVPVGIMVSLVFAFLLNHDLIGQRLWRFLYFSPLVTSSVSVALIFTQIYSESPNGWLNALLLKFGFIDHPILFLKDERTFLYCVIGLAIWHGLAFTILLFLAGLQQIPQQLYRAAEIDGAGFWRKFWHISLPGLRPQIVFVVLMGVIGAFQVFEPIYMLGGGSGFSGAKFGPNDAGKTMVPLIFDLGFERFKMGQAAAVAYLLFGIIFILTLIQLKVINRRGSWGG